MQLIKYSKSVVVLLCLMLTSQLQGQEFNPYKYVTQPSPTAIQFQKFVDAPVGQYTGTPVINIPLHTINAADIEVPLVLMYHGSGVKFTEHASWVGAGWTLSAGGMITRTVHGLPDFEQWVDDLYETFSTTTDGNINQPPSGTTGVMHRSYYETPLVPTSPGTGNIGYMDEVLKSTRDAQPDVFYYHFLGQQGKFFIDQNGNVINDPSSKLKIRKPTSSIQNYWIITDNTGTQYFFGQPTASKEWSKGFKTVDHVSSWYLNKIVTVSGNKVEFNYIQESSYTEVPTFRTHNFQAQYEFTSGFPSVATVTYAKKNEFRAVRLSSITFDGVSSSGTVDFIASKTRADSYQGGSYLDHYALDEILVKDANDDNVLQFDFNYVNHPNNLWLDEVTKRFYNDDGTAIEASDPPHKFTYNGNLNMPTSLSYSIDYWGYYNGKSNGTSLLPITTYSKTGLFRTYSSGADRTASLTFARYGSLSKVDYPGGSSREYEYELNTFTGFTGSGAGLRVKKITVKDGLGSAPMVTAYQYTDPVGSGTSGKLLAPVFTGANVLKHVGFTYFRRGDVRSTHPFNLSGHQAVGYSAVVELEGANGENGRTVYYFENDYPSFTAEINSSGHQHEMISAPYEFNSNLNGRLEKIQVQKNVSGSFSTLKETEYQYTLKTESLNLDGLLLSGWIGTMQNGGINNTLATSAFSGSPWTDIVGYESYEVSTDWYSLNRMIEREFEGVASIVTTTDFSYYSNSARELKNYVSKQEETFQNGKVLETDFTYPFNGISSVSTTMTNNHQQPVLEKISYFRDGLDYHRIGGYINTYSMVLSVDDDGIGSVNRPMLTEIREVIKETTSSPVINTRRVQKINSYNYEGRVVEEEDAYGMPTTYVWKDNILLAEVRNARANEVHYENFEYNNDPGVVNNPSLSFTGDKYSNSFTSPGSVSVTNQYLTYWRNGVGGWQYVKVDFTGQNISGIDPIDEVRIFPKDAQVITYIYDPFKGNSAMTDINGRPTYYTYDDRDRLESIRDLNNEIMKAFKYVSPTN